MVGKKKTPAGLVPRCLRIPSSRRPCSWARDDCSIGCGESVFCSSHTVAVESVHTYEALNDFSLPRSSAERVHASKHVQTVGVIPRLVVLGMLFRCERWKVKFFLVDPFPCSAWNMRGVLLGEEWW